MRRGIGVDKMLDLSLVRYAQAVLGRYERAVERAPSRLH
jgi:hypothetical protein